MSRFFLLGWTAITVFGGLSVIPATAQPPRDRSRGGDQRGFDDPSAFLKQLDRNNNGTIDPDEFEGRRGGMAKFMAQRAGLDTSKPMPLDKLVEAMKSGANAPGDSRDKTPKPADSPAAAPASSGKTPSVPGFGSEDKTPQAAGFDVPLASGISASAEKRYSKQVTDYVDRMLLDYDKNKDNVLDAEEMKNVRFQSDPKESDLNKDGKLDRQELLERIAKRFGTPPDDRRRGSTGSGGPPSAPVNSEAAELAKFKDYAKSYIKERDLDSDGMLDRSKSEWEKVIPDSQRADVNRDGVITVDELAAFKASGGKSDSGSTKTASVGGPPSTGPPPSSFGSPRSDKDPPRNPGFSAKASSGAKKTYRPIPPIERLPAKNLPDWFLRNDENEDGQISMAEYASLWSDSKAAEFTSYDLDGDGFITAKECLKKEKK